MAASRQAASVWAKMPVSQRVLRLNAISSVILNNVDRICACVVETTGKVPTEALLGEIYPVLALVDYYQKHAERILSKQPVFTSAMTFPATTATIERKPFGCVAVFSPWNYPFQLSLAPMLTALYAGNSVVLKPSELTLPVAELILELLAELDLPEGLVQWLIGAQGVGEMLIDARPDLIFFTGGLNGGRAVMARAARHPIPVILELGGKDAMIVLSDANLDRVCAGALYGAFSNSGQICVSVERLYVQKNCYDALLKRLLEAVAKLQIGHSPQADIGAMTSERQRAIVQAHYEDALSKGAKASGPLRIENSVIHPVVLWDVDHSMRVMREETFGPMLPVMAFDSVSEAIALANDSDLGLSASVWSRNLDQARAVARQLVVGSWAVNDVIKQAGHAGLPFGGLKNSGFGRYHGAEGLLSFSQSVPGMVSHSRLTCEPHWFPYSEQRYDAYKGYLDFLYGEGSLRQRSKRNRNALRAFADYAGLHPDQQWRNLKCLLNWQRKI